MRSAWWPAGSTEPDRWNGAGVAVLPTEHWKQEGPTNECSESYIDPHPGVGQGP